jgi:hypothetical protein
MIVGLIILLALNPAKWLVATIVLLEVVSVSAHSSGRSE